MHAQRYLRPAWGPRAVAAELSRAASPAPGPAHVRASARAPDPAPALSGPASACSAERAGLRRSAAPAPRSPRAPYAASVGQRGAAACARHCAGATRPREACACNVIGRGGAFRKGRRFTIAWGVVLRRGTWPYDNISMVTLKGPELYDDQNCGWEASVELYDTVGAWLESGPSALTTREGRGLRWEERVTVVGRSFASGRALRAGAERYHFGERGRVASMLFCDGACG